MRKPIDRKGMIAYLSVYGGKTLKKARDRFGSPQSILRSAALKLGESASYDDGASSPKSSDDEIAALRRFAEDSGLLMEPKVVKDLLSANAMRGGAEHKVAANIPIERVLKVLDTRAIATESLFDYLTDIELSNTLLGDDIQIEGFFEDNGKLHVVISQPWVDGSHPSLEVMKAGLEAKGFVSESPTGSTGVFILPGTEAGDITVIDVKPDNVILDNVTGEVIPIDFHFYFDSHRDRKNALEALGLGNSPKGH